MLRGVFSLSAGTFVVQALSAAGQFVLAIWLAPDEFGYWAAAVSAMAVLTALTNFGEVNGYLAGRSLSLSRTRASSFWLNTVLALFGLGVSALYFASGQLVIGVYCVLISAFIPVTGDANVQVAACLRANLHRSIVVAQTVAALAKFALSIVLAVALQSALALAISAPLYYLVVDVLLIRVLRRNRGLVTSRDDDLTVIPPSWRERASWALNSYFMTFPTQAIFLSAQFVLSPGSLGLLYLGFQLTIALSGLLSVPLNRVSLSTLSRAPIEIHGRLVSRLGAAVTGAVASVSALLAIFLILFTDWLPGAWIPAVPLALLLLVSLPMRILTPIVEAYQQARNRWWQASSYSLLDAVGSAVAVVACGLFYSVWEVALGLTVWKVAIGLFRTMHVMATEDWPIRISLVGSALAGSLILGIGAAVPWVYLGSILFAAGCVGWLLFRRCRIGAE